MRARARILAGAALAASALAIYACTAVQFTGSSASPQSIDITRSAAPASRGASGDTIQVVTWNLGYAGLGAASDFFADGGRRYLPPSRKGVVESADAIAAWLGASDADVVLIQENARGSAVNLWVDLKSRVDTALSTYDAAFYPDFQTRLLPPPLRIQNGQTTYARGGLASTEVWPLPADGDPYAGALRRRYAALVSRVEGPQGCWTFVNVHTSAFDEGAALRRRQISALFERAQAEERLGRRVVIGGDFNMRLSDTDFPHDTEERFLFWVHDFPHDLLPEGWRLASDATTPSVRTNERPYRAGHNYTTVIDGFLLSPGVELVTVHGVDMGFRNSDHQPVRAVLKASGPGAACQT